MTHPQVFGMTFTPIHRFSAWKAHPFWPHIPNMTQYGSAPPGEFLLRGCKMEKRELVVVATPGPINPLKITLWLSVIHSMPGAQCFFFV